MIIAIDYDNTYTADPKTFNKMIALLQEAGHTVVCITSRDSHGVMAQPVLDSIGKLVPVVFAGKDWKREAAEKHGYKIDIWIDDTPETIGKQMLIGSR